MVEVWLDRLLPRCSEGSAITKDDPNNFAASFKFSIQYALPICSKSINWLIIFGSLLPNIFLMRGINDMDIWQDSIDEVQQLFLNFFHICFILISFSAIPNLSVVFSSILTCWFQWRTWEGVTSLIFKHTLGCVLSVVYSLEREKFSRLFTFYFCLKRNYTFIPVSGFKEIILVKYLNFISVISITQIFYVLMF